MLQLREVHSYYGDSHILQGVSLNVPKGSIVALLGRNGVGKSTTVHSIIGFNPPSRGEILFDGIRIDGREAFSIARLGIALVPQGRRIFPSLTVLENLVLGWRKTDTGTKAEQLEEMYQQFPILRKRAKHQGDQLSGGEQQMLAIARALMSSPRLILMDEPLEGLAPLIVNTLCQQIIGLKERGISILLVEQNLPAALRVADYAAVMSRGKIVYEGTSSELKTEKNVQNRFLTL